MRTTRREWGSRTPRTGTPETKRPRLPSQSLGLNVQERHPYISTKWRGCQVSASAAAAKPEAGGGGRPPPDGVRRRGMPGQRPAPSLPARGRSAPATSRPASDSRAGNAAHQRCKCTGNHAVRHETQLLNSPVAESCAMARHSPRQVVPNSGQDAETGSKT